MSTEIFLKRPHRGISWGFRLIGGSDSHLPIIVSKVIEGSVAEQAGLEEDVLLERVNNVPTAGLTHAEVNQVILSAENELLFTIRRVDLENLILASLNEEENNSEIAIILRQTVKRTTAIQEEEEELEEFGLKKEFGVTMIIDNNKKLSDNQVHKESQFNKYQVQGNQSTGKKWSTFLQKPKNPKPKDKNQAPAIPKSEQYKVIITKQPKREKPEFREREDFGSVHKTNIQEKPVQEEHIEVKKEVTFDIPTTEEIPMELEISVKKHVTEETEITIEDAEEEEGYQMTNIEHQEHLREILKNEEEGNQDYTQYEETENEKFITDVQIENPLPEDTLSLEEQLAAVQKQLQELAQLPSSIQETLAVVTQQLAHIVGDKKPNPENTDEDEINIEEENELTKNVDEAETEETAEEKEIDGDGNPEDVAAEISDLAEMEDVQSDILSDIREEQEVSEKLEEISNEELIEAQLEEQRIEEEKLAKQQLAIEEEENRKKKSGIRPIILPGGRKWVDPDDVVVKVKNPKMTDEKICNTLESFSEVIVGHTKGINFLKYTPPPKNLEYLQRSEVYRLVHGMEPPVRGISLREEKILAAQDYYTAGGD